MSIVSTREGREGGGERNLHLSGQLDNYRVQGPQYYHVWACCSEPFLRRVHGQTKPSPAMPCPSDVPSAGSRCFPHAGGSGHAGLKASRKPGACRPAALIPAVACSQPKFPSASLIKLDRSDHLQAAARPRPAIGERLEHLTQCSKGR